MICQAAGHNVCLAAGASEALEHLALVEFDAVLMGLYLPAVDGFELMRMLRARRATARLPLLVVTSQSDLASRERARAAGANDVLTKPYSNKALCLKLDTLLQGVHLGAA